MHTTLDLPADLYEQAKRAATSQGVTVEQFITRALQQTLRAEPGPGAKGQHVRLPLVPSSQPGKLLLTAERVAALLNDEDVSS